MKVLEIKSISKEESFIYYINRYKGMAVLEILSNQVEIPVTFAIETSPFSKKTIEIGALPNDLNYPVMPVQKALREYILTIDKSGVLPQS